MAAIAPERERRIARAQAAGPGHDVLVSFCSSLISFWFHSGGFWDRAWKGSGSLKAVLRRFLPPIVGARVGFGKRVSSPRGSCSEVESKA